MTKKFLNDDFQKKQQMQQRLKTNKNLQIGVA